MDSASCFQVNFLLQTCKQLHTCNFHDGDWPSKANIPRQSQHLINARPHLRRALMLNAASSHHVATLRTRAVPHGGPCMNHAPPVAAAARARRRCSIAVTTCAASSGGKAALTADELIEWDVVEYVESAASQQRRLGKVAKVRGTRCVGRKAEVACSCLGWRGQPSSCPMLVSRPLVASLWPQVTWSLKHGHAPKGCCMRVGT